MRRFPGKLQTQKVVKNNVYCYAYVLTDEQDAWLRKWFPITPNEELVKAMGIGMSSFRRMIVRMGLKKDTTYIKKNGQKAALKWKESREANGRKAFKNPKCSRLWTKQKGPFVTVATKISKDDYDKFIEVLKANRTTKFEVIRGFVKTYISNFK